MRADCVLKVLPADRDLAAFVAQTAKHPEVAIADLHLQ
jgi:hypothetical protein